MLTMKKNWHWMDPEFNRINVSRVMNAFIITVVVINY